MRSRHQLTQATDRHFSPSPRAGHLSPEVAKENTVVQRERARAREIIEEFLSTAN